MVVLGNESIRHLVETKGFSVAVTVGYKPFTHSIGYQKKGVLDIADAGGAAAAELVPKLPTCYSRMLRLDLPIESMLTDHYVPQYPLMDLGALIEVPSFVGDGS